MSGVVIVFASGAGHSMRLAEEIALGAGGARLMDVAAMGPQDWDALHAAGAIVFGAPTYMGNVSGPFKTFMDETSDFWVDRLWKDKLAAGFTVGSAASGDKANTLGTLSIFAAQQGMIWVGQDEIGPPSCPDNPVNLEGFWLGLGATSSRDKAVLIDKAGLETARRFGARIAAALARWGDPV